MKHIISVLVENKAGVLAHVSGLFSSRGFNIDSLAVGETEDPALSRMTLVTQGDAQILEQIIKQLRRLINVVKVQDISRRSHVQRDLTLIKLNAPPEKRAEIVALIEVFRGRIVDVSAREMMLEISGPEGKLEALVDLLQPYGIKEMVRTGRIALTRGESAKA